MVDYNQALDARRGAARAAARLTVEGISWLEEPIRHDDYAGNARSRASSTSPIQIGENFNGPHAMEAALAADACD